MWLIHELKFDSSYVVKASGDGPPNKNDESPTVRVGSQTYIHSIKIDFEDERSIEMFRDIMEKIKKSFETISLNHQVDLLRDLLETTLYQFSATEWDRANPGTLRWIAAQKILLNIIERKIAAMVCETKEMDRTIHLEIGDSVIVSGDNSYYSGQRVVEKLYTDIDAETKKPYQIAVIRKSKQKFDLRTGNAITYPRDFQLSKVEEDKK